jgi:hypothetical protein
MSRRIVKIALALLLVLGAVQTASAQQYGRRSYSYSGGYNPSRVNSNFPGWQRTYPGSSRNYGHLKYYERADRRPLGLTP